MKEQEDDNPGFGIFEKVDKDLGLSRGTTWDESELRPFFRTISLLTLCCHFPSHIFKSLHRCLVANTGMPALSVVEDLDVFEDCSLGLSAGSEPLTVHQLLFQ